MALGARLIDLVGIEDILVVFSHIGVVLIIVEKP
jgi:hypothetical protein